MTQDATPSEPADDPGDGSGNGPDSDEPGVPDPNDYLDRRTLIKALIAIAFGIPILIEARTFVGLVGSQLFGDDDESDGAATTTGSPEPSGVGVGDELLTSTPQAETVESMRVDPQDDAWVFSMTVSVANEDGSGGGYQFRILSVTGEEGTTVSEDIGTARLSPGESERIAGSWELPPGERPESVQVAGLSFPENGTPETDTEEVPLGNVAVQR